MPWMAAAGRRSFRETYKAVFRVFADRMRTRRLNELPVTVRLLPQSDVNGIP